MQNDVLKKCVAVALYRAATGADKKQGGPFGAVVARKGKIIARAHNTVLKDHDPTCHAEINAIRKASRALKKAHLDDCVLVSSSEPCPMCLAAAWWARIGKVYYCLPREIAARAGFADEAMYRELSRMERKNYSSGGVKRAGFTEMEKEGRAMFARWKKKKGRWY